MPSKPRSSEGALSPLSTALAVGAHLVIIAAIIGAGRSPRAETPGYRDVAASSDSAAGVSGLPATRARNLIEVRVVDALTGLPLEGAAVREFSMESPAHTGRSGTVTVALRPAAKAEARVTREGYASVVARLPNRRRTGEVVTVSLQRLSRP
jgi:hypothetical protein